MSDEDKDRKRLYSIWNTCRKRTLNPKNKDYPHYGGRGIRMCKEWEEDFETFRQWAMSHGYRDGLTMDRVNNNAGYNPGNVRWISRKAQARNRTTNTYLTVDGRTRPVVEWCEIYGIPDYVVVRRIKAGWSPEDAVKRPVRKRKEDRRCSEDTCTWRG